jgi:hypothetical protein
MVATSSNPMPATSSACATARTAAGERLRSGRSRSLIMRLRAEIVPSSAAERAVGTADSGLAAATPANGAITVMACR